VALPVGFDPLVIRNVALGLRSQPVPEKVVVHCGVADLGGLVDVGARDGFERCEIGAGLGQRDVLDCSCNGLAGVVAGVVAGVPFCFTRHDITLYHVTIINLKLVVAAPSFTLIAFAALIAVASLIALVHEPPDFGGAVLNHVQEVAEVLAERAALALQVRQREPAHVRLLKVAVIRVRRDGPQISGFLDEAVVIIKIERQALVVVHAH
ncbi:MAG: hypothetical protein EB015_20315, partial [Methylocystaceae bacterium]|nr:hypothetical protein [Methylocystaceae bacterium]